MKLFSGRNEKLIECIVVVLLSIAVVASQLHTGWETYLRHSGDWLMLIAVIILCGGFTIAVTAGCFEFVRKTWRLYRTS